MMVAAVIGDQGFIGKALCKSLREEAQIAVKSLITLPENRLKGFDSGALSGVNVLYYLASATIPASSWNQPEYEVQANLIPFMKTMDAAVQAGVSKIIYVSSGGTVYGPSHIPVTEDSVLQPFSPYGVFKGCMEHYLNYINQRFETETLIFRISNVYGPGQNTQKGLGIINTFIEQGCRRIPVALYGNGASKRDFIFIDDVVNVLKLSAVKSFKYNTYNLASGTVYSIAEIATMIQIATGLQLTVDHRPARASDNTTIAFNINRLKQECSAFIPMDLKLGIQRTHDYILQHLK